MADGPLPFDMGPDKSREPVIAVVVCLAVATVMVGLRIYTRGFIVKEMSKDDWAAIVTLLLIYATGIVIATSTKFGLGKHVYNLDIDNLIDQVRLFWISTVLHAASLLAAKATLILQYYRVLALQRMRIVYIIALLVVFGWGISQVFIKIFMCDNVEGYWNPRFQEQECLDFAMQNYIETIGDVVTSLAIFVMPMPVLKHLNLPKTERLVLVGIFTLGFFTVVIAGIRIRYIQPLTFTWDMVELSCWSLGELASALTCACLPTLRPFFAKFFLSLTEGSARATLGYDIEKKGHSGESGRSWWRFRPKREVGEKVVQTRHELGNEGEKYEAPGDGQRHEAPGDEVRYEMPGDIPDTVQAPRSVYQANARRE